MSWVVYFVLSLHWINLFQIFQNGGSIEDGGRNYPLKGQKGQILEGGTRGAAFVHSPFLANNSGTVNKKWVWFWSNDL